MATSVNCCLKPTPPPTTAAAGIANQAPRTTMTKDPAWRRRSMAAAAACVVVLGIVDNTVSAEELRSPVAVTAVAAARKWSERRTCPSWNTNSLESIMPENLPRPSARRRMEAVSVDKSLDSPSLAGDHVIVLRHNSSCFSL